MTITIDKAGRIVVPKAVREALRFVEGAELEMRIEDGRLIVEHRAVGKHLVDGPHGAVIVADEDLPPLTDDLIRSTLQSIRR
jgi:AbrB family looped-hinge helix DNA binding protein